MAPERFIRDVFDRLSPGLDYEIRCRLEELFPGRAILQTQDWDFDLFDYVREGLCTIRHKGGVPVQALLQWREDTGIVESPRNGWYEVSWLEHDLEVLILQWADDRHVWILAEDEMVARRFFEVVCAFDPEFDSEVLVFQGGRFDVNPGLYRDIQRSSFENLVLEGDLARTIRDDLERFFSARATYDDLGVPWKRGILLTGPPGNGKTHTIQALVQTLGKPCLYVKSLKSECYTEETNLTRIFYRARKLAPAIVVLEDLDALVTEQNRSFLLNELDGFAQNTGLVVIATTNHPERLDPALVERPSRFDRKYHFALPGEPGRREFLTRWDAKQTGRAKLGPDACAQVAARTEGFSYAYLKELLLTSLLQKAAADADTPLEAIVLEQVDVLRAQMKPAEVRESD